MYVYVYVYVYVCLHVCVCTYVCVYLSVPGGVGIHERKNGATGRKQGREREDLTAASLQCMERVLVLGVWCLVSGAQGFVHLVWAVTLRKTHPRKRNSWDTQLPM